VAAPTIGPEVERVEVGYFLATLLLSLLLWLVYRAGPRRVVAERRAAAVSG
jgi:hypothetical protein